MKVNINIPENWELKHLGDMGKVINGLTYSPDDIHEEGVLVLRSSNVQNRSLTFDDNVFVNVGEGEFNPVIENDILICVRNGSKNLIGKNALITKEAEFMAFGAFMTVFRSPYNKFLFQVFDTDVYNNQVYRNLGATINSINGSDLKKFKVPFPPLSEQQKIAEILSTWDEAITLAKTTIEELKLRNKGIAQQLLTGKKRLNGFSEEWNEVKLGDIAERITRKNEELDDTVVTISAQRGFVLQEDFFNKRVASDTLSGYYLIHKGEFAYNKSYSNGYPMGAFKRLDDFPKAVVTTLYICFKLKESVNSDFVNQFFQAGLMVKGLSRIAQEGGRAHGLLNISLGDFFSLQLFIPEVKEQQAIASILQNAEQELKIQQQKLESLQEQKKGLMQKLLTGEVRVKTSKV